MALLGLTVARDATANPHGSMTVAVTSLVASRPLPSIDASFPVMVVLVVIDT